MSAILEVLFGSRARARLLRFFLQNTEAEFSVAEIARKNIVNKSQVRRELAVLRNIKFVSERMKKGRKLYILNQEFPFYPELRSLIVKANIYPQCKSLGRIKSIGDVKLAIISGIFLNYVRSKADLLLVANHVSRARLNNLVRNLEAEIGREICYVLMNSDEFKYRLDMMDRFLLDFLEGPHDEIVNKIPKLHRLINGLKK